MVCFGITVLLADHPHVPHFVCALAAEALGCRLSLLTG